MLKKDVKKLDKIWADKIKERANYVCEYCLEEGKKVEAAHIVGRSYRTLRWDLQNGMCLCTGCHFAYDKHLPEAYKIRRIVIGNERLNRLLEAKKVIAKNQDYEEIKEYLDSVINC